MSNTAIQAPRALACALFLASAAVTQVPAVEQASTEKASRALDELIEKIDAARAKAFEAKRRAETARTDAERAEVANRVAELSGKLQSLTAAFAKATESVKDEVDPLRNEIHRALRLDSLKDVESALKKIEKRELEQNPKGALIGLVQISIAGTLRLRAEQEIKTSRNDKAAEKLLLRAVKKYQTALRADDISDPKVGSSTHATSLRHIVQIEASLYDGYATLAQNNPNSSSYARKMSQHHTAGVKAVDKLRRLHPDATLADGSRVVYAIQSDVRRLTKKPRRRR